jgi:hypothetical protein
VVLPPKDLRERFEQWRPTTALPKSLLLFGVNRMRWSQVVAVAEERLPY